MRENVSTVTLIDLTDTSSVSHWRKLVASALHFVFLLSDCVKAPNIPLHYCHMASLTLNLVAPCVSFISQVIYQLPQPPHHTLSVSRSRAIVSVCLCIVPFQRIWLSPSSAVPKKPRKSDKL